MGREVKRVSVDFDWPLNEVWEGFINPFYKFAEKCFQCDGSGYSSAAGKFYDQWYGYYFFDASDIGAEPLTIDSPHLRASVEKKIKYSMQRSEAEGSFEYYTQGGKRSYEEAIIHEVERMFDLWKNSWSHQLCQADVDALVEAGRLCELTSRPNASFDFNKAIRDHAYFLWIEAGSPESDGLEFWCAAEKAYSGYWLPFPNYHPTAEEVNAWSMVGIGHDSINAGVCVEARAKRQGFDLCCTKCDGEGSIWHPLTAKQQAEDWEPEQPPIGDAYQIWETVSEGSPISPAFLDPSDLATWMVANDRSVTSDMTYDNWMNFILGDGWAPSMIMTESNIMSGAKAISEGL
jgi:hypothetical protein